MPTSIYSTTRILRQYRYEPAVTFDIVGANTLPPFPRPVAFPSGQPTHPLDSQQDSTPIVQPTWNFTTKYQNQPIADRCASWLYSDSATTTRLRSRPLLAPTLVPRKTSSPDLSTPGDSGRSTGRHGRSDCQWDIHRSHGCQRPSADDKRKGVYHASSSRFQYSGPAVPKSPAPHSS